MKNIVHGYLLVDLIFEITSEKWRVLSLKILFFEGGVDIHTPPVLKGLTIQGSW